MLFMLDLQKHLIVVVVNLDVKKNIVNVLVMVDYVELTVNVMDAKICNLKIL